ncbi:MAG: hypothetical protein ACO1NW_13595 [Chitinophagaceae bacterium]
MERQESLQLIEAMINKARNQFSENGHLYLLWGWVVLVCSLVHFTLLNFTTFQKPWLVWLLTWAAVAYQTVYLFRKNKQQQVRTYTDDILKYVWICFVICMFLLGFVIGTMMGGDAFRYFYPVFLVLYGVPTFLSGIILRFRPLVAGAIGCWALSLPAALIPFRYQLLLLAAAVLVAWIIPGYMLRARFKQQQ